MNLDLRPVQGRLCIVTDDLKSYTSSYQRQHQCSTQRLMLPMNTVPLCSQDGNIHPTFGQDECENISQWLKTCMADHSKECPETTVRTEFTVYCIDCEDEKVVPMPHNAKYFALSYVWGDAKAPDNDDSLSDAPPRHQGRNDSYTTIVFPLPVGRSVLYQLTRYNTEAPADRQYGQYLR